MKFPKDRMAVIAILIAIMLLGLTIVPLSP
jgi:hypothetical protein